MRKELLIYNLLFLIFITSCSTEKTLISNNNIEDKKTFSHIIRFTPVEEIKELILKNSDVKEQIKSDRNLLTEYLSYNPKFEIVKLLLENGARLDINKRFDQNNSLIHILALSKDGRDPKIFKLLLDYGENINAINAYGDTPLISLFKSEFNLNEDLSRSDEFDLKNYLRKKQNLLDSLNFLVENGSNVNIINKYGLSFVDYLIMYKLNDLAIKYLEKKEVLDLDKQKYQSYIETAVRNNNIEILNFLLEKELYKSKKVLSESLTTAIKSRNVNICKLLIKKGADINFSPDTSFTLLSEATNLYRSGDKDFLYFLLENKINVNATKNNFESILLYVFSNNEKDLYNLLISNGGTLNYINSEGQNILISFFTRPMPYIDLNLEFIIKLIDNGVNFNVKDKLGNNLLSYIIRLNSNIFGRRKENYIAKEKVLKHLISKGLDVSKKFDSGFAKDKTPLRLASELKQIELINVILENPAVDINAQDDYGDTALIVASRNQDIETIKTLLEHKADISIKNKFGNDALSIVKRLDSNKNELTYIQKDIIEVLEKYEKE